MSVPSALYQTDLPNLTSRGKVRDMYASGDEIFVVASDRISAFDVVMEQPIPGKGIVLTQLSKFWLETLKACRPHHLIEVVDERSELPPGLADGRGQLQHRTMRCHKAEVLPVECVVRGYIVGGGWKEYQQSGTVSGIRLPAGMQLAQQFDEPLFTPSTKAEVGHDEPISFEQCVETIGADLAHEVRARALAIYGEGRAYAAERGIILADTKFEFGLRDGELILIDEVLTPDSSRFWPADAWQPGENPPSFDKQYLRDWLNTLDWDKNPPPPAIPDEVLVQTGARYVEAYEKITGRKYCWG